MKVGPFRLVMFSGSIDGCFLVRESSNSLTSMTGLTLLFHFYCWF